MCLLISPSIEVQYFVLKMDVASHKLSNVLRRAPDGQFCYAFSVISLFLFIYIPDEMSNTKLKIHRHTRRHPAVSELPSQSHRGRDERNHSCIEYIQIPLSLFFNVFFFWHNQFGFSP